jgi:hypothetical protein
MPDAGARETIDHVNAKFLGGAGGVLQFFDSSFVDASRIAVTPNLGR